ncbi:MAG: type II toxin-antitoxin system VapC family toxin [Planctomycetes bacterium]|nr:type II toxin-antitoxin system VapC family toxin [Planctomycetota bacterium]MBL7041731.1 type II toxin-antitoxin system VapC family toxin [Pirellulaceae bacterium]
MFIIDTDHIGVLQRQTGSHYQRLSQRIAGHSQTDFYVAIVSFHEQILGWNAYIARAKDQTGVVRGYGRLEKILNDFSRSQVLPFDEAAADIFGDLRNRKIRIGTMDLRIAAIALATGMTVLSRNLVDFQRVPNLNIEDWT